MLAFHAVLNVPLSRDWFLRPLLLSYFLLLPEPAGRNVQNLSNENRSTSTRTIRVLFLYFFRYYSPPHYVYFNANNVCRSKGS